MSETVNTKENQQSEIEVLLAKKLRSLKKKLEKANKLEEKAASGTALNEEQTKIVRGKSSLESALKELNKFGDKVVQINKQEQKKKDEEIKTLKAEQAKAKEQPKEEVPIAAPTPAPQTPSVSEKELAQRFVNLIHFHTNGDHDLAQDFTDNELEASHRLAYFISNSEENPADSYTLAAEYLSSEAEYHDGVTFKRIREVVSAVSNKILQKHAPQEQTQAVEEKTEETAAEPETAQEESNTESKTTWYNDLEEQKEGTKEVPSTTEPEVTEKQAEAPAAQEATQPSESAPAAEAEFKDQTGRVAVSGSRGGKKFRNNNRGRGDRQDNREGRQDRGDRGDRPPRGEGAPRGEGRGGFRRGGGEFRERGEFKERAERGEFRERQEGDDRGGFRGRGRGGNYRGRGSPRPDRPEGEGQQGEGYKPRPNRGGPSRSPRIPNEKNVPGQGLSGASAPTPVTQQ